MLLLLHILIDPLQVLFIRIHQTAAQLFPNQLESQRTQEQQQGKMKLTFSSLFLLLVGSPLLALAECEEGSWKVQEKGEKPSDDEKFRGDDWSYGGFITSVDGTQILIHDVPRGYSNVIYYTPREQWWVSKLNDTAFGAATFEDAQTLVSSSDGTTEELKGNFTERLTDSSRGEFEWDQTTTSGFLAFTAHLLCTRGRLFSAPGVSRNPPSLPAGSGANSIESLGTGRCNGNVVSGDICTPFNGPGGTIMGTVHSVGSN